jgi:hypothetical protein
MKFRLRTLLIAIALTAHACAKQSWIHSLCADGSTPATGTIPFAIQTEFDDGEAVHLRTYFGACGIYKLVWSTTMSVSYTSTRHCWVPKLMEIDGSKLDVMIRGTDKGFVHLSGFVQTDSDFDSAMKILDEHDWAGSSRAYVAIAIRDSGFQRRFWHELPN